MNLIKNTTCWYKWLSIIGFGLLYHRLVVAIYYKEKNYNLYFRLLFKAGFMVVIAIFFPATILAIIAMLMKQKIVFEGLQYLELICLYISGVIATSKLYKWAQINISEF